MPHVRPRSTHSHTFTRVAFVAGSRLSRSRGYRCDETADRHSGENVGLCGNISPFRIIIFNIGFLDGIDHTTNYIPSFEQIHRIYDPVKSEPCEPKIHAARARD